MYSIRVTYTRYEWGGEGGDEGNNNCVSEVIEW